MALIALHIAACGGGGGGESARANRAPVAADDVMRADGAALAGIDVLANDDDPDNDSLTVTIEDAPPIGTASVNSDGTVHLADLPSDFKGLTHFSYRVTDPDGETSTAGAAIFVGTDPFRVIFAGDEAGNGATEVYLTDFTSPAIALTDATEGNRRLRGFVASDNGATVVYRRQDTTAPATTDLHFIETDAPVEEVPIELPDGIVPMLDAQGDDQFQVSPDGQWIAVIAGDGTTSAAYVLDIDAPETATRVSPLTTAHAQSLRFSLNSDALYFLASDAANGGSRSLYTVALNDPSTAAQISAPVGAASADDVLDYSVSPDQSRILLLANRGGDEGIYFVNPSQLQTEIQVSHPLAAGETIVSSTIGRKSFEGSSPLVERVAYTTRTVQLFFSTDRTFVAEVSATPDPKVVGGLDASIIGFRPDSDALLYSQSGQVNETVIDGATADEAIGDGFFAWYDSTGNIVLLEQLLPVGGSSTYPALAVAVRGSFGAAQALGTSGLAAHYINTTGFDRGVVIIGEGPTTGSAPANVRLALVNALAREELLDLAEFDSPLDLTSDLAQVVAN